MVVKKETEEDRVIVGGRRWLVSWGQKELGCGE